MAADRVARGMVPSPSLSTGCGALSGQLSESRNDEKTSAHAKQCQTSPDHAAAPRERISQVSLPRPRIPAQAGPTSDRAPMSMRFQFNWVDTGPSSDTLARDTMATLSIAGRDKVVTAVLDRCNRSYRDHVIVPLYHVAEWLVANWWHIWYEVADTREQRAEFEFRHNLAFAGDGFVLPNLYVVPESGRMHLRWTRSQPQHARIEFVDESEMYVERPQLEHEFRTIINAVLERLRGSGRHEYAVESLADAWDAVNALDSDEQEFSRAAALLGIDPYEASDDVASALIDFWQTVDPSIREDALASASEESLRSVGGWLRDTLHTLQGAESGSDWPRVRQVVSARTTGAPWTRGYDLARCARGELSPGDGRFEFDGSGDLAIRHVEREMPSPRIHGLVAVDAPTCATTLRSEPGTRFLLARALGDYLDRPEASAGILTSLATDSQAQNRAFAAEFLAPADALRAALNNADPVEPDQVDVLAHRFGVSGEVIRRQIENHELASIAQV